MARGALRAAAVVLCLLVVVAAAGIGWLALRPLPVPFLVPQLESALSEGGRRIEIGEAELGWGGVRARVEVRATDVRVLSSKGDLLAEFPTVKTSLRLPPLLRGRVEPRTLTFDSPVVNLVRNADGSIEAGVGDGGTSSSSVRRVDPARIQDFVASPGSERGRRLVHSLSILAGDITLVDRARGLTWHAKPVDLTIERQQLGLHASAEIPFEVSGRDAHPSGAPSQVTIRAEAQASAQGKEVALDVTADLNDFDVASLRAWWPPEAAPDAREWVLANIPSGTADAAKLDLSLHLPSADGSKLRLESLSARVEVQGVLVRYLDPLPPVTNLRSVLHFAPSRFDFEIQGGAVQDLSIENGTVTITGLDEEVSRISIEARLNGPIGTVLSLLEDEPLGLLETWSPRDVRGHAESHLKLGFPLHDGLGFHEVHLDGEAEIHELETDETPLPISDGHFDVSFSNTHLDVSGELEVASIPASLEWKERFGSGQPIEREIHFESTGAHRGQVKLRYAPGENGATLRFESDDPGALMEVLDWSDRMKGGSLEIDAVQRAWGEPLEGEFKLTEFSVLEATWLLKLIESLSFHGLVNSMRGEGLELDSFDGSFTYADGVLEFHPVHLVGSTAAARATGSVHVFERRLDVRGTVVPWETFSHWIDKVPVLGTIFTGADDKGLFAADFHIHGPLEDPTVRVDRLASLTPGILRDLAKRLRRGDEPEDAN